MLHESIQNTTGKHATHASTFQHQSCIPLNMHKNKLFHIQSYYKKVKCGKI